MLSGWVSYFRKSEVRIAFEELDQWIRRKLRAILWRQWKRNWTRARELMRRGLAHDRAWTSATNGRGPWWNAGASHMNQAVPTRYLSQLGLREPYSGITAFGNVQPEPPYTEPYVRCCGRTGAATPLLPDRLARKQS